MDSPSPLYTTVVNTLMESMPFPEHLQAFRKTMLSYLVKCFQKSTSSMSVDIDWNTMGIESPTFVHLTLVFTKLEDVPDILIETKKISCKSKLNRFSGIDIDE